MRYPSVTSGWTGWPRTRGSRLMGRIEFEVATRTISASRLILATGVRDELPAVPGLAERWGRSVFHCPTAMATELNEGRIGIIAGADGHAPGADAAGLGQPDALSQRRLHAYSR